MSHHYYGSYGASRNETNVIEKFININRSTDYYYKLSAGVYGNNFCFIKTIYLPGAVKKSPAPFSG